MRINLLTLAAATLCIPATISAEEPKKVTIEIPHGDLDLAQPDDAAAFKKRIAKTIKDACLMPANNSAQRAKTDWTCVETAKREALAKFDTLKAERLAIAGG